MQNLTVAHTCGHDREYQIERHDLSHDLVNWLISRRCFDCGGGLTKNERKYQSPIIRSLLFFHAPKRVPPVGSQAIATTIRHGTPLTILQLADGGIVAWCQYRGPISMPERIWQDRDYKETHIGKDDFFISQDDT
jgi:hypothetical protein